MKKLLFIYFAFLFITLCLSGCNSTNYSNSKVTVLLEDNPNLFFNKQTYTANFSSDLIFQVGTKHGEIISSINYDNYSISPKTGSSLSYDYYDVTLYDVKYPVKLSFTTSEIQTITYHFNMTNEDNIMLSNDSPHIFKNTLIFDSSYSTDGYTAIGWNTKADGSGEHIGFGSRLSTASENQDLYLDWLQESPSDYFEFKTVNDTAVITGYKGNTNCLVIPSKYDGKTITAIASNAFKDLQLDTLVIPSTITDIEMNAFENLFVQDFYYFDTLNNISDNCFINFNVKHLHINAAILPVYSGSYFDTFSDKVDYLKTLSDQNKIILFCGSSARFGYNSSLLAEAFNDYEIVNMGVYAYSNMLIQGKIILKYIHNGDIILSSPELDSIDKQFCENNKFDKEVFCMAESNYDNLSLIDCTDFSNIFNSYKEYIDEKISMESRSYEESPSYYDEDGNLLTESSYNKYGDYVVYRKNNDECKCFGIKRAYYNKDHFTNSDIDGLNSLYDDFTSKGATVLFTYSPRSNISVSDDTSTTSIEELDKYLRANLNATFISDINESLMNPLYFYGTDNHLSTEGAVIHTKDVIDDLKNFFLKENS